MDIIIITGGGRPEFLNQTLSSLRDNASQQHNIVLVEDGPDSLITNEIVTIKTHGKGASAARNIGASSIPGYRRHQHVMFLDDDTYLMPEWDEQLTQTVDALPNTVLSGHAHPFNHSTGYRANAHSACVLSTVHFFMPWSIWDHVGYFVEPGGPGGSEDVEWCKRAVDLEYQLAVTDPMCVIHCGLTSSHGQQIVGYDLMMKQNEKLVAVYGLKEEVNFG